MDKQSEFPHPFLQLLAFLYGELDWEHPDPHFMDRGPASQPRPLPPDHRARRPSYLTVVPRDHNADGPDD